MIITSAILLILSTQTDRNNQQDFDRLIHQLAEKIEWIDNDGSRYLTADAANVKLKNISRRAVSDITPHHFSQWKNGKCYWIFEISTEHKKHRLFFYCLRDKKGASKVTKIKVT